MKKSLRGIGAVWVGVCIAWVLCLSAKAAEYNVALDVKNTGDVISPLLFGHNLEHTRQSIWHGISAQMLANRKFAAVENGLPKRWTALAGGGQVSMDDTVAFAGPSALRVENGPGGPGGLAQQQEWLAFLIDSRYAFRVWIKSETARTVWIRITDADQSRIVFRQETTLQPGDWQLWEGEFVAPAPESNARFEIGSSDAGVFWIGAVSLMPADHFHGMRRDVVELLKTLKPGCLRWPGGCFAEYYPWQDGLLPVDRRPPLGPAQWEGLLPDTDGFDNHEIGIDEFIALCRELGCAPIVTIRYGEGSPEEAASWVEYCNGAPDTPWGRVRAERGHPVPYGVHYWYVGNEIWGISLVKNKDPQVCAVLSRQFGEAMKQADPSVALIGCAPTHDPAMLPVWLAPLLAERGDWLGMVQGGFYFPNPGQVNMQSAAVASVRDVLPMLKTLRQFTDRTAPDGERLGIAFYEWNAYWNRPGDAVGGVFAASMLNLLCREAEPLGLVLAGYFQPVTEGAILVEPTTSALDPTGEVFVLYAAHQGNRLLKTPEPSAEIDLCASVSSDGRQVCVTVLNRSTVMAHGLELSLNNGSGRVAASMNLLTPAGFENKAGFLRLDKRLTVEEGNRVELSLPPCGIARILFDLGGPR